MNSELKIKRVSSRKRSRDSPRTQRTPAGRRAGGAGCPAPCPGPWRPSSTMAQTQTEEFFSDSEDLFADYDSLLQDGSLLAQLDHAEQAERQRDQPDFTALRPASGCQDVLTDSILDVLGDEDLPSSQVQFQQHVQDGAKRSRSQRDAGHQTSTPARDPEDGRRAARRRSVAEQLKRTMLCNAAAPPAASRSAALQEAVVSSEISGAVRAMEAASAHTPDLGPFFGLPSKVKELMAKLRGISSLYDWQETCLNLECVRQRKNLIYSLPTSGGKTLVAEILILRELLCRKKNCLFILPYVSLVQEKVRGLASFGLELDFMVEEYAGSRGRFPPVRRRNNNSLYVATIEKAHSLVNSLTEAGRMDDLGLVVVDELHMLGDGSRGALMEMTLAKVLYLSKSTQIIGMSATLGNIQDLQAFLRAENYTNDFRPVQLKEYVKLQDTIYEVAPKEEECFKFSRVLNVKYSSSMQKLDPDHIIALVTEVIPTHSCLVFCPTKKNCENVAAMICRHLKEDFLRLREEEKEVLLSQLCAVGGGAVCPVLRRTVPYGLAYHHSGLTAEERLLLEEAYSRGVLCLLACTSTLAAGINLPARRVVLRSPYVAASVLRRTQYQQMVGRAGRAGIDSQGESVLILQPRDTDTVKRLVCAPMERCVSQLLQDGGGDGGGGLLCLLLSLIGLKVTSSLTQLMDVLSGTLLAVQQEQLCVERSLTEEVQQRLLLLKEKGLVSVAADGDTLQVTRLGRATFKGSVDLSHSVQLYRDLSLGLEALVLSSHLHLVYLVTPYDLLPHCRPDWRTFFTQFTLLSPAEQKMAATIGVPESYVARKAAGQTVRKPVDAAAAAAAAAAARLYLALVLLSLLRDSSVWIVAERFQLSRGFVQNLLSSAAAFCCCVLHFTEELEELWAFRALLAELTRRLSYCVTAELVPLMEVGGVTESRAKQLYNAGYKTLTQLANADPAALSNTIENLFRKQANQIVASAKMLLNEKAAALQEEVDELLMKPSN